MNAKGPVNQQRKNTDWKSAKEIKRFYILCENVWVTWPTKSVLRSIHCWLHLFSRLTATTSLWKTLQKLWKNSRPRLASRRLWNIFVTSLHYMGSSPTQDSSCMMDTYLERKWTWSQHRTWTSWPSFGELPQHEQRYTAIQFVPVIDINGTAVPMATSPKAIHLTWFLFSLPASTRNWLKQLHRVHFHSKTDLSVQLLCSL